jgi:hypothetical protein
LYFDITTGFLLGSGVAKKNEQLHTPPVREKNSSKKTKTQTELGREQALRGKKGSADSAKPRWDTATMGAILRRREYNPTYHQLPAVCSTKKKCLLEHGERRDKPDKVCLRNAAIHSKPRIPQISLSGSCSLSGEPKSAFG